MVPTIFVTRQEEAVSPVLLMVGGISNSASNVTWIPCIGSNASSCSRCTTDQPNATRDMITQPFSDTTFGLTSLPFSIFPFEVLTFCTHFRNPSWIWSPASRYVGQWHNLCFSVSSSSPQLRHFCSSDQTMSYIFSAHIVLLQPSSSSQCCAFL